MSRFDASGVLSRLKDFQRRTVDTVFRRMYLDDPPSLRFLVADEVGLGKTLVARGIIARALEHLQGRVRRVDIVYICSNAAIAQQNVNRLNVSGQKQFAIASRLTLLPTQVHELDRNPVNFISFTPGTSLDPVSREGARDERIVLFRMLRDESWIDEESWLKVLQCRIRNHWPWWARESEMRLDPAITAAFKRRVNADGELKSRIQRACADVAATWGNLPWSVQNRRLEMIKDLRLLLASECLVGLEPDLVILDEFQRFRDILDGTDPAAVLARDLFTYKDVRVLLLSATPYKMLSLNGDDEEHYPDFLRTLGFLLDSKDAVSAVEADLQRFRRALLSVTPATSSLVAEARTALESRLRRVMCRSERVRLTAKRDAMLHEAQRTSVPTIEDLDRVRALDRLSIALGARDAVEYWKSIPYPLTFLRHYDLRNRLAAQGTTLGEAVAGAIEDAQSALSLDAEAMGRYQPLDAGTARMRALAEDTIDRGVWRLLWLPPSLPYWRPSGAYADVGSVTKALVFSAWNAVPDAVAALLSYEAERRMIEALGVEVTPETLTDRLKPLLRFTIGRDERLTGMPALALLFPAAVLAENVDPLRLEVTFSGPAPTSEDMLVAAKARVATLLASILAGAPSEGSEDQRWYWAAPALLEGGSPDLVDFCRAATRWRAIAAGGDEESPTGFGAHLDELVRAMDGRLDPPLGRPPADLLDVVARIALAGPGTCAVRALRRVAPEQARDAAALLDGAVLVAGGLRTLYNLPESIALLRGGSEESYWRAVLGHNMDGNLQSVLDEQVHVLKESLGVVDSPPAVRVSDIAGSLAQALSIKAGRITFDQVVIDADTGHISAPTHKTRARFALRFGDLQDDNQKTLARVDDVRTAFNSPFRPFVLATTSIGQEGLDFHTWCHAVVHWNLPYNPVDLEQREGRVHRFKGHAVRKNVAQFVGLAELLARWDRVRDPWDVLFERAGEARPPGASEIIPYWVFEEGPARVERRVPLLAFSRDVERLRRLKRGLALYRLVFGQPRQQDLLSHLEERFGGEDVEALLAEWQISLAPDGDGTPR